MSLLKDAVPQLSRLPSGHVYGNDGSGKFHFQSTLQTSRLAELFERTVERLGELHKLPVGSALILSLPIRNAICTPYGLASAVAALHNVYRCGDHIALDWKLAHGWRDRRLLEPLTVDLLASLAGPYKCTTKDRRLAQLLIQDAMAETDPRQVWNSFCACAAAWWSDPLPYLIWSHCVGVQPLQPLSRETWARYHTKLPLVPPVALVETQPTPLQSAYFSAGRQSASYDCILQAIAIVNGARRKHKSRQAFSDAVLKGLSDLLHEARDAGRLQVLLVGFIVDLVTNGGIQGQLAIGSLVAYLQQTLLRLFNALLDKDLNALGAEGWRTIYQSVLRDDTSVEKQRNKISAALSAFHNFIAWLGVPPLPGGVIAQGVKYPPRAELVWPQDIKRAVEWLEVGPAHGDRVSRQAIVVLLLLNDFMVRIEEVLGLRLGDFLVTDSGLTLYVYPRIRDGRMKANAVRRAVDLKSPELLRRLRAWIAMRKLEAGADEDFLFGSPRQSRARCEHAQTYALVELALKIGSGDPDASSHGPRHRLGSQLGAEVCMPTTQFVDINPIDQISSGSGQGITHSLRSTYLNIYEESLRACTVGVWGDEHSLSEASIPAWIPTLDHGIEMDRTEAWKKTPYAPPGPAPLTFETVLSVLTDLSQELTAPSAIARNAVTANTLKAIARAASSALNRIRPRAEQRYSDAGDFGVHQLTLIELEPLIAAHNQEKYEPIVRWLSGALSNVASRQILKNALSEWRGATKGYCISLDAVQDVLGLVVLLKATGIPRQRILITHRCPEARLRPSIRQLGWHLRHEEVVRRGLPRIRLHICSVDAVSPGAIDGAISIKGLLGLLAAAEAWLAAREGTAPE